MIDCFAITSPFIPRDHPMHDYAQYIVGITDAIYAMLWVVAFMLAALVVAFIVFAVQKYWDRKEDERRRRSMDAAVAALMGLVTILDVIKANTERKLDHTAGQIKDEIAKTPEVTAAKVAEKLDEIKLSESGVGLKAVPPRTAAPKTE